MTTAIESRPLGHGRGVACDGCADCVLLERLAPLSQFIFGWDVVGEGVVRGQMFQADLWRYVRIGEHLTYLDVTEEFMCRHVDGRVGAHRHAMYTLVTGQQSSGVLR